MSGRTRLRTTIIRRLPIVAASAALAASGIALPATALQDCYRMGYDEGMAKGRQVGYDSGYKEGHNYKEASVPPGSVTTSESANRRQRPATAPAQPPQCVGDTNYDRGYDAGHKAGYDATYGTGFVAGYNAASKK